MAYTFAADTDKLETLKTDLEDLKKDIDDEIKNIFNYISIGWQEAWQGEAYDLFVENCLKYQDALNEVPNVIQCFINTIEDTNENASTLIKNVDSKLDQIN